MSEDNLTDKINYLNDEIYALKSQITRLETELNKRELENYTHLETIEHLEDVIMKLESLIPEEDNDKKSKKQKALDSKLALELEDRDIQIRDLKNRMGFLRKEKVQLQQEFERLKTESSESKVIRTEDIRSKSPLEILVKDLQDKVNKQKSMIQNLKREYIDVSEFDSKIKKKEEAIERKMAYLLQTQIDDQREIIESKNKKIEDLKIEAEDMKNKVEVLEVQLNIKDQKIKELNEKLNKSKKKKK
jgi:chromosome segregation protein